MRHTILMGCIALLVATSADADSLNKCIDAQGQVTYSNLPCRNAREVRAVEIDPLPLPDPIKQPIRAKPVKTLSSAPVTAPQVSTHPATGQPAKAASARQCDSLTDKLGTVFDKMDQARRKGYTQEQMDKWNQEVKALETKKQQSGCF